MKIKKQMLFYLTLVILISSLLIPIISNDITLNQNIPPPRIDSIHYPHIDGFIDDTAPLGFINEWGDGYKELVTFLSLDGEHEEIELTTKMIQNQLFGSFIYSQSVDELVIQIDINGNEIIDNDDVQLKYYNNAITRSLELHRDLTIHIFFDGAWYVPNDLYSNLWNDDNYIQYLAQVGRSSNIVMSSHYGGLEDHVEFSFNIDEYYGLIGKDNPQIDNENAEVGYSIMIKETNGNVVGFPSEPEPYSDDHQVDNYKMFSYLPIWTILPNYQTDISGRIMYVTQSVQVDSPFDTLRLVRGKPTLLRVIVNNDLDGSVNLATVKVSAKAIMTIQGQTVPISLGSLSKSFVPTIPNADILETTANFELPELWTLFQNLLLSIEVTPINKIDTYMGNNKQTYWLQFHNTHNLKIYYIRVNSGTADVPSQVPLSFVEQAKKGVATLYPMGDPMFIELPWERLGLRPTWYNKNLLLTELNEIGLSLYFSAIAQKLTGSFFQIPIPDQVFAFTTTGAGKSTPGFTGNKISYAAWGGLGAAAGPLVMAHEINHNIGNFLSTWGRHVGAPSGNDPDWGCGAPGPDPFWPTGDDRIRATYTDTIGWNPVTGIISEEKPDIMSYCTDSLNPIRWISDYRWEHWVDRLLNFVEGIPHDEYPSIDIHSNPSKLHQETDQLNIEISNYRIIRGFIRNDSSGQLLTSYSTQGYWNGSYQEELYVEPSHTLVVNREDGSFVEYPLGFDDSSFDTPEHDGPSDTHYFDIVVNDESPITEINLVDSNGAIISTLTSSPYTVTGSFSVPTALTRNSTVVLNSDVRIEGNSTNVYSTLQYSADGIAWSNIGSESSEVINSFELHNIPGGDNIQFRMIFTNGFDTKYAYSSNFVVIPNLAPTLTITMDKHRFIPEIGDEVLVAYDYGSIQQGSTISLTASGIDPETGILRGENISWTINNEAEGFTETVNNDTLHLQLIYSGSYTIDVTVTDDKGASDSKTINIVVIKPDYLDEDIFNQFMDELQDALIDDTPSDPSNPSSRIDESNSPTNNSFLSLQFEIFILPIFMVVFIKKYRSKI